MTESSAGPESSVARARRAVVRGLLPRTAVRAFWLQRRLRVLTRRVSGAPSIELYFAFDDPYGAVAVPMLQKLARRHGAQLALYPVAEHGIAGDPDLPLRRAYAITDAARLLRRRGDSLLRTAPLQPTDVAFLAAWAEAARDRGALEAFTTEAMAAVWQSAEPSLEPARFRPLYQRVVGAPPPDALAPLEQRVTRNAARLRSRGHWETPAARIAGEWFFAHEREEQMSELLSELKA